MGESPGHCRRLATAGRVRAVSALGRAGPQGMARADVKAPRRRILGRLVACAGRHGLPPGRASAAVTWLRMKHLWPPASRHARALLGVAIGQI
ncbi:hypothetical protein GUJ93_ZPchr0013g33833 [Zizania palustris]|uniref:Uncharacterized protein n=1 Tax=Zizania palustris TaxID=103762 RepID=A0A8J5WUB9_ZIZPA|nr:hypothetical protein GUJ93_ZPchr0013g33833 [Zizania palustris]